MNLKQHFVMTKREKILTIILAGMIVAFGYYQAAYGTNETSYKYGYTTGYWNYKYGFSDIK